MSAPETPDSALALKLLDLAERVQRVNVEYTAAVAPEVTCGLTEQHRVALTTKAGLSTAAAGLARLAESFAKERAP